MDMACITSDLAIVLIICISRLSLVLSLVPLCRPLSAPPVSLSLSLFSAPLGCLSLSRPLLSHVVSTAGKSRPMTRQNDILLEQPHLDVSWLHDNLHDRDPFTARAKYMAKKIQDPGSRVGRTEKRGCTSRARASLNQKVDSRIIKMPVSSWSVRVGRDS